ncbi:MAG TPA: sulfatase-like hydrolase/transferase, partial [Chryseolinea sp.]|nr:sulfatase-like hydrolase/transferase [Chryseolinea sp.]
MKQDSTRIILLAALLFLTTWEPATSQSVTGKSNSQGIDRTMLPIKEPKRQTYKELDARNATPPPRFEVKAPAGAPNIIVVLIDDMGFGVSETFGGSVSTPTMNKLASNGIKYNRFHTTALCSPTRVALLTGYNHHSNNMGSIAETATTFPGNTGV